MQVRAARGRSDAAPRFDLWRIPGCKRLHGAGDLVLNASVGARHARVLLDAGLHDGSAYVCTVPLTAQLRGQLTEFQALAALVDGHALPYAMPRPARPVSRAGLLHLRALLALDAVQAGASQRDIAIALFGPEAVRTQWHADGVLRAQVRHLVARAKGLMQHGYLDLAGVRHGHARAPGDEQVH